jgi:hypothetical protein
VLPITPENVLLGQNVQSAAPICVLNVPGTHARQGPASGPVNPLLHTQTALAPVDCEFAGHVEHAEIDVAPITLEKVFAEQLVHTAVPITVLYFPGTHNAHGPPFGPVAPALQVQAVSAELLTTELDMLGQLTHVSELLAPILPE